MFFRIKRLTRNNVASIILFALKALDGALAQLGERLHGMEEVESSILLRSTI